MLLQSNVCVKKSKLALSWPGESYVHKTLNKDNNKQKKNKFAKQPNIEGLEMQKKEYKPRKPTLQLVQK